MARSRRNEIQGVLLAASVQRCNVYKSYLRRIYTMTDFSLGSLATIFGGVGAIITGVQATHIFSGLASVSSGLRAEFNQDMLSNLTTSIIIPGIEKRRSEIMTEIAPRRCLSLPSYSLSTAIEDAIRFHGACATDVGIAVASTTISRSNEIGLDAVKSALQKANDIQALALALNSKKKPTDGAGNASTNPSSGGAAPKSLIPPSFGPTVTFEECKAL